MHFIYFLEDSSVGSSNQLYLIVASLRKHLLLVHPPVTSLFPLPPAFCNKYFLKNHIGPYLWLCFPGNPVYDSTDLSNSKADA